MWIVVKQSWNSRRLDHEPLNWVMIIQQSLMLVWFWLNAGQDEPAIKLTVYICLDRCLPSSTNILGRGDYCLYDSLCPSCNASLPLGCQQHVIIVWSDIQWGHSGYQQPHQVNFSHQLINWATFIPWWNNINTLGNKSIVTHFPHPFFIFWNDAECQEEYVC